MGTSESKSVHELDAKHQQNDFCCTQNRKVSRKPRRKASRSESSDGRDESVEMSGSIFTAWTSQPEQKDASNDSVLEKIVNFQESFGKGSFKGVLLSENSLNASNPSKKEVKSPELPYGWKASQLKQLKDSVHRTASELRRKSPGFFALQVTCPYSQRPLSVHQSQLIAVDVQGLRRARSSAATGNLLSAAASDGPYGDRFWAQVALGVPGRTAGECLDAYLFACYSPVARFSASDSQLQVAGAAVG
jgi:hypothetical protein